MKYRMSFGNGESIDCNGVTPNKSQRLVKHDGDNYTVDCTICLEHYKCWNGSELKTDGESKKYVESVLQKCPYFLEELGF